MSLDTFLIRIINNQSFPHDREPKKWGNVPISFNAGIEAKDFPTLQITSKHLLIRITKVGEGAVMCKMDWADAYK